MYTVVSPRGQWWAPLLFVMYINDLPALVDKGSDMYLFADDTKLYREILIEEDCQTMQDDLDKMSAWSEAWDLYFHPDKWKVIRLGGTDVAEGTYKLGDHTLQHVQCEKDIGVTIDSKLNFGEHISEKINKANSIMGIIRRTFTYLDEKFPSSVQESC